MTKILYITYDDGGEIDEPRLVVTENYRGASILKSFSGKKAWYLWNVLTQREGEEE